MIPEIDLCHYPPAVERRAPSNLGTMLPTPPDTPRKHA